MFTFVMQPGDFVLFQHDSDLGRIIQHVSQSWASHAAFAVEAPDQMIEAADFNGVRHSTLAEYVTIRPSSGFKSAVRRVSMSLPLSPRHSR
jgi:hypothetical protein